LWPRRARNVADKKPTLFELASACYAVRDTCEFLSITALVQQLTIARRKAARYRDALAAAAFADNLKQRLANAVKEARRDQIESKEYLQRRIKEAEQ
jgi:hypothetical protein